jgi:hypothetical protein
VFDSSVIKIITKDAYNIKILLQRIIYSPLFSMIVNNKGVGGRVD